MPKLQLVAVARQTIAIKHPSVVSLTIHAEQMRVWDDNKGFIYLPGERLSCCLSLVLVINSNLALYTDYCTVLLSLSIIIWHSRLTTSLPFWSFYYSDHWYRHWGMPLFWDNFCGMVLFVLVKVYSKMWICYLLSRNPGSATYSDSPLQATKTIKISICR